MADCVKAIRREFRLKQFCFGNAKAERFCCFLYNWPAWLYLCYRAVLMVYTVTSLAYIATHHPEHVPEHRWWSYLTQWSYLALCLYLSLHCVLAFFWHVKNVNKRTGGDCTCHGSRDLDTQTARKQRCVKESTVNCEPRTQMFGGHDGDIDCAQNDDRCTQTEGGIDCDNACSHNYDERCTQASGTSYCPSGGYSNDASHTLAQTTGGSCCRSGPTNNDDDRGPVMTSSKDCCDSDFTQNDGTHAQRTVRLSCDNVSAHNDTNETHAQTTSGRCCDNAHVHDDAQHTETITGRCEVHCCSPPTLADHHSRLFAGEAEATLPWSACLVWVTFNITSTLSLLVTLVYYGFYRFIPFYNPDIASFANVNKHAINSAIVIVEHLLTAVPYRLLHFVYPLIFCVVYLVFTVIVWAEDSSVIVYPRFLDWRTPGRTLGYMAGVGCVAIPLVHALFFGVYKAKMAIYHRRVHAP